MQATFSFLGIKKIWWLLLSNLGIHVIVAALSGNVFVSDEGYYVPASIDMLHGVASNFEHPPLVKGIIALFIEALGNNWIAWRLPTILFALLSIWLTYKIASKFLSEKASTFAAAILSLSVIFLWMGSTAMLDIPAVALGLAGVYFVLSKRYGWGGLMFALSFLCKELAILMFMATLSYLLLKKMGKWQILFFSMSAFTFSFVGLWIYDFAFSPTFSNFAITNPAEHIYYMIMHYIHLQRTHGWYPPISWVSPFGFNAWTPMTLLSWFAGNNLIASWSIQPNAAIEYLMLPLLTLLPLLYFKRKNSLAALNWLWLATSYLPWLAIGFFVKTEVNYYIVYSMPFLAIGSTYLWTTIQNKKLKYCAATTQLIIALIWFIAYMLILPLITK